MALLALFLASFAFVSFTWAIVAQSKLRRIRKKFAPIVDAQREATNMREGTQQMEAASRKMAESIIAKAKTEATQIKRQAERDLDELEQEKLQALNRIAEIENERKGKALELNAIRRSLSLLQDDSLLMQVGYIEPDYEFSDLPAYEAALSELRAEQKKMLLLDGSGGDREAAAFCSKEISFDGSVKKGKAMLKKVLRLMLRAFNGECDAYIARVTYKNIGLMEKRIENSYEQIGKIADVWYCHLSKGYLENRLRELRLVFTYEEAKQREREEQAQIRAQMKDEERALRELEKARSDAERAEEKYRELLDKAKAEAEASTLDDRSALEEKVSRLEAMLAAAEESKQRAISQAQLTRSGHVYIISNVGSFGEHVYKIGMTRRLEPLDRVRELGDASVPFPFDVHALIFTKDAPSLESSLHRRFDNRRVNLENLRKEFFKVTIEEIREELLRIHQEEGTVSELKITLAAEAKQYRQSEAKRMELERTFENS
ncbi:DUF4041 domain-containing protein [Cyanobium sp. Copco_Reservoir_LC18]|uniref:DUF4041 domain-containing protein n=1 Tax=Cyanobium sp. Copco_Reservoir_LC18 TaxID=1328305 RepID=UPI0013588B5B|nr:DUF4041 domain-containing protein [Cyanobium sp. Copco_Reservoir_LC18]